MEDLLNFFIEVDKLKRTYRYSTREEKFWDSSADHSWRLSLMVISVAEQLSLNVNVFHSVKLALCHDIPEYITGDIDSRLIHYGKVTRGEKSESEKKALEEIKNKFGELGEKIYELCWEFKTKSTQEALYVRALDKIEAITHLISVGGMDNDDFAYTATHANKSIMNFPELKPLWKSVQERLKEIAREIGEEWRSEYDLV
jgi:5'-deoxynucleotidase YfbR-like HD superfamily hydrolase